MEILKCRKGQALIRQGSIATEMFEIVAGQVGIYMDYGDEAQKEISILSEGDFVGELELIDSSVRIASAVALGNDVVVKKLTIEDFNELVQKNPAKVILMIQQLAGSWTTCISRPALRSTRCGWSGKTTLRPALLWLQGCASSRRMRESAVEKQASGSSLRRPDTN